jgi:nucleoside-diphosphate-sugar epimerase
MDGRPRPSVCIDNPVGDRILTAVSVRQTELWQPGARNSLPRVVVTGANGFIGANLCRRFVAAGHRVTGFVRRHSDISALAGVDIELIRADLRHPGEILLPADTRCIVHAAAVVSDSAGDAECRAGILEATLNLATAAGTQCPGLERFIYISTALVLGYGRRQISAARPGRALTDMPYVRYKRLAENHLLEQHRLRGLPVVVLRPADVYGPYDRTSTLPMLDSLGRGFPLVVGAGTQRMAYCYVDNLTHAVERACLSGAAVGRCYTVCNSTTLDWRAFFGRLGAGVGVRPRNVPRIAALWAVLAADALRRVLPMARPRLTVYRFRRAISDTTYDASNTVRDLGYCPDEDVPGQLGATCRWYLSRRRDGAR